MNYKIKSRIWIEAEGRALLGEGKVRLLKAIDKMGSVSKAAKSLEMSYKKAWCLVALVDSCADKAVITTRTGGKGGGGATLTPYGKKLIKGFDSINTGCWKYLEKQSYKINNL